MKVAVVGSGIAGLGAAHYLAQTHDVHVFEADSRPGGHANTVRHRDAEGRELAIDTGFLVHNGENYPHLTQLFVDLGIATQTTDMSFSVTCERCGIEYSGGRLWRQPRNLISGRQLRLYAEIARFIRRARAEVRDDQTLAAFCEQSGYSRSFRDHFLLPLAAALWSTSTSETFDFPAAYAIRFFEHHGMLRFRRFQWRTVSGGSRRYVDALIARLPNGVRLNTPVLGVSRNTTGVTLRLPGGVSETFDTVILACHADQSLALLDDADEQERSILGAFGFVPNDVVLHTDTGFLPRRRGAGGAWNYRMHDCANPTPTVTVTYDVTWLQSLPGPQRYLVTLNRTMPIAPGHEVARFTYSHPRYSFASLDAQARLPQINGRRHTWFCGAWTGNGFHEDGLRSAYEVATALTSDRT